MANYKYAARDYNRETMARSVVLAASVSTKHCIEICSYIKGKRIAQAKKLLRDAAELKTAIPFKRFNHNVGHKKSIGPGRYPVKACREVIRVLDSCEANAQFKGINTSQLMIIHASANLASRPWHYGRARRRRMKRTHIEIVVEEEGKKPKKKAEAAEETKPAKAEKIKEEATKEKSRPEPKREQKPELKAEPETKPKQEIRPKPKPQPRTGSKPEPKTKSSDISKKEQTSNPEKPKTKEEATPKAREKADVKQDGPKQDSIAKD